jgi:heme-degrading monooxygenase HmoA
MAHCFVLRVRVAPDREREFLERYAALGARIEEGLEGHVAHQLCRSADEPDRWVLLSYWESLEDSERWERSPDHAALTLPLRDCFLEAERAGYVVEVETRRR